MSEEKQRPEPKIKPYVIRKQKLKNLMANHNINDLRFMYFEAGKYNVTAVTKLNREDEYFLTVAFSFCSPKDTFCKAAGKVQCLERMAAYDKLTSDQPPDEMSADDVKYIITMPFAQVPSLISIGMAYNMLPNKPDRLKNSMFQFDVCGCVTVN